MASFFIPSGLTFTQKDLVHQFFEPLFIDSPEVRELFQVVTDVKTSKELLMIGKLEKITKGYQQGTAYTSSTGLVVTPKTLSVSGMKAQIEQTPKEFLNSVYQVLLAKGVQENDLENSPDLKAIILGAFMDAMRADLIRQAFFGDTTKETMTNTGGLYSPSGTLDEHYKEYLGFWQRIINGFESADIAASQLVDANTSTYQTTVAVKGKKTATLTGTSGTANVNINGTNYLATFATDLTTTAANFETAHAATIAARFGKCTVTASGVTLIVEAGYPGMNVLVTVTNVSGNLAGSVAATTAAVKNTTLKAGAAKDLLQAVYEARSNELGAYDDTRARFFVTRSVYENYLAYLQTQSGAESAFVLLTNGTRTLSFNGIPLLKRADWDKRISNDFGGVMPHRILLTVPENLVIGTDGSGDDTLIEAWYEKKDQLNYVRAEYKMGTQYVHGLYIAAAY